MADEAPPIGEDKPATIEERENGPLVAKNVENLLAADGEEIEHKSVMALCRCGASKNKPFCDGSHEAVGFSSDHAADEGRDEIHDYYGKEATVYYNKPLCCHIAECLRLKPEVFDLSRKPWIKPDNGSLDDLKEAIAACPSGALFLAPKGEEPEQFVSDKQYVITVKNGPYVVGNVDLKDAKWAEGASPGKYVLCRCGASKNKPFCDGNHLRIGWRDD